MAPLQDHLHELRLRILFILGCWILLGIIGIVCNDGIIGQLLAPLSTRSGASVQWQSVTAAVVVAPDLLHGVRLRISAATVPIILLGFPIMVWQGWLFGAPALAPTMKRRALRWLGAIGLLWTLGASVTILIAPWAVRLLIDAGAPWVMPLLSVEGVISFWLTLFITVQSVMALPGILAGLLDAGVFEAAHLGQYRRFIWVGGLVLGAVITPTGDPIIMVLVALPLIAMVEVIIAGARWWPRRVAQPGHPAESLDQSPKLAPWIR